MPTCGPTHHAVSEPPVRFSSYSAVMSSTLRSGCTSVPSSQPKYVRPALAVIGINRTATRIEARTLPDRARPGPGQALLARSWIVAVERAPSVCESALVEPEAPDPDVAEAEREAVDGEQLMEDVGEATAFDD